MPHPPKNVQFSKHEIGRKILALRQQRGLSQVELAAALRIHQTNVSAMERGIRGITVHQLAKLSKVFGVPAQEILGARSVQPPAKKPLKSLRLIRRLQRIEKLPDSKQRAVLRVLDALLDEQTKTA